MRRVVVLVSAIVLLDVLFYSAIAPLLPAYAEHLGLSKTQAGVLSGSYALGTLLLSLPAGWLAAHRGTRATLLVGLALMGSASIAFGLGTSFAVLDGGPLRAGRRRCRGLGRRSGLARRGRPPRAAGAAHRHGAGHRASPAPSGVPCSAPSPSRSDRRTSSRRSRSWRRGSRSPWR